MASITRKVGNSGKVSPFWRGKFKGPDARTTVWLTTKCTTHKKALAIAELWEKAAYLAAGHELAQPGAQRLIKDVEKVYSHPDTMEVTRRLADELLQYSLGDSLSGQDFQKFCAEWLKAKEPPMTKLATYKKYRTAVNSFLEFLPERRRVASVASISAIELKQFRDSEIKQGVSNKTANITIASISSLFNEALCAGIITNNPAKGVKSLPNTSDTRIPFSEDQIRAILAVADKEWTGMVLISAFAGLRIGDASRLTWGNLDLANQLLSFEAEKTREKVSVVMHPDLVNYCESLPAGDDPGQNLFPTICRLDTGGKGLSHHFKLLMEKAGIERPVGAPKSGRGRVFHQLGYHSLRHNFCSTLANLGVSPDVRRQMSGHRDDEIHARYCHMDLTHQRKAVSQMPSLF
jgi:integrase